MNSIALFVLGPPGAGKTTAIRNLVSLNGHEACTHPNSCDFKSEVEKPKWTVCGTTVLAGHYRGHTFDGGDTVPYSGARAALEYWREHLLPYARLTIFDGDRFSTQPSLDFVRATGVTIAGVLLQAQADAIAARCAERGSNQNATWIKGRVTKANNFAAKIGAYSVTTACTPQEVVDQIELVLDDVRRYANHRSAFTGVM